MRIRTRWTDRMEKILKVVTINNTNDDGIAINSINEMSQSSLPFRPTDIVLPTDCSGFVYMLVSLRSGDFFYIGK